MSETRSRKTIEFPVGDYAERLDRAFATAMAARDDESTSTTMLEGDPYAELKSEYDALREASREASREAGLLVVLEEIPRSKWRQLKAAHPPRTEGDEETVKADRIAGFNTETAEDDLVQAALVEPTFTTRAAFDEWADELGAGKFASIAEQAYLLTVGARHDPKSLPDSPTRKSD